MEAKILPEFMPAYTDSGSATQTMALTDNTFDQATQTDQPFGPEPESTSTPPKDHNTDGMP